MSQGGHVHTRAAVIRAGDTTTLLSVEGWFGGQILAPADTGIIETATGKPRQDLPGTQLSVMARLAARSAEELDLRQWKPLSSGDPSRTG